MVVMGTPVKCKQLRIITVLSRQLGPLSRWDSLISNISELGYNAVHYTPIQLYGESYSHYSLADQTRLDDYFFTDTKVTDPSDRVRELSKAIGHFRNEHGVLGIIDIVLNHTASNSPWLLDHPESAYNTDDCPHLYSAWLLDNSIALLSLDFANRKIPECPSAPYINNEKDMKDVLGAIQNRVINKLNLAEFFLANIGKVTDDVKNFL